MLETGAKSRSEQKGAKRSAGASQHLRAAPVHPSLHPPHLSQAVQEGSPPVVLPEARVDPGDHEAPEPPGETRPQKNICRRKKSPCISEVRVRVRVLNLP